VADSRFFGSGVILATAVVHLLDPAIKQIGLINTYEYGGCISNAWGEYPYPVCFPSVLKKGTNDSLESAPPLYSLHS
jgi:hypothetical protein